MQILGTSQHEDMEILQSTQTRELEGQPFSSCSAIDACVQLDKALAPRIPSLL